MRVKNSPVCTLEVFLSDLVLNSQVQHCAFQAVKHMVEWTCKELKQEVGIFVFVIR